MADIAPARDPAPLEHAALWRRLVAMLYDGLLLFALWMVATAIWLALSGGAPIAGTTRHWYQAYLALVAIGFFSLFWRLGGQTLGMRAWRLQLRGKDGPVHLRAAIVRALASVLSWLPLGLGFIWSLIDQDRLAWHDRLSGTHLIVVPKADRR